MCDSRLQQWPGALDSTILRGRRGGVNTRSNLVPDMPHPLEDPWEQVCPWEEVSLSLYFVLCLSLYFVLSQCFQGHLLCPCHSTLSCRSALLRYVVLQWFGAACLGTAHQDNVLVQHVLVPPRHAAYQHPRCQLTRAHGDSAS